MKYQFLLKCAALFCITFITDSYSIDDTTEELLRRDPFQWLNSTTAPAIPKEMAKEKKEKQLSVPLEWQLDGISWSAEPCAMLSHTNQMFVMRHGNDLGNGWRIEKITETQVMCKHSSGEIRELKL